MKERAFCTIIAKNYLAHARTLVDSLQKYSSEPFFVLVVDDFEGYFDPEQETFTVVSTDELDLPSLDNIFTKYSVLEASTVLKPFFMEHLLKSRDLNELCYLDPDIFFFSSAEAIWNELSNCSVLLTPHILETNTQPSPFEMQALQAGAYNLGFIGIRQSEETIKFLKWWQTRVKHFGGVDLHRGVFVDQKWIDLAPSLFSEVEISKNVGLNVAYWNIEHRPLSKKDPTLTILEHPLIFFHFSGYEPSHPERISKHSSSLLSDYPKFRKLFEAYKAKLIAKGYLECRGWPYSHDYLREFPNKIPASARVLFRESKFGTGEQKQFISWLKERSPQAPMLSNLALSLHQENSVWQKRYPDILGKDQPRFAAWIKHYGSKQLHIPKEFLDCSNKKSLASLEAGTVLFYRKLVNSLYRLGVGEEIESILGDRVISQARKFLRVPDSSSHSSPNPVPIRTDKRYLESSHIKHMGINIFGYLNENCGIGEAARNVIRALRNSGISVSTIPLDLDGQITKVPSELFGYNLFFVNADQMPVIYRGLDPEYTTDKYSIGFWHWELEKFPKQWIKSFDMLDELWVASSFIRDSLRSHTELPIHIIGNCVPKIKVDKVTPKDLGLPANSFIFLNVFDARSGIERKNPFGILEAYRKAGFAKSEKVSLVIKGSNLDEFPRERERLCREVMSLGGVLLNGELSLEYKTQLFDVSDAYISLHRSEGFGLTIAEAMGIGMPVIATEYSGNCDYMNATNSFPVSYNFIPASDYGPLQQNANWAEPNIEEAAALLRLVTRGGTDIEIRSTKAARDIKSLYSENVISTSIHNRLSDIALKPTLRNPERKESV